MRFLTLVFGFSLAALPAQQILQNFDPLDFYQRYTPMGDVNGDGYEDMLTTSLIYVGPTWVYYDYELRFYSGRDGSLLRLGPRWPYPDGGFSYPTGDHDHDGVRDYICFDTDFANLVNPTRRLSVRSGRDDHVLWMLQAPPTTSWVYHVIGDLDVNGDGELDVVVSHPTASNYGAFWAYDHQGNLLYNVNLLGVPNPNYTLGLSLAKLGDINGDGCDDYIMGLGVQTGRGAVAVISGVNGQFLRIVTGQNVGDYIGSGCTGCGDLDGDGLPDFAAGGGLSYQYGSVQAFSSATGARLFAVYSGLVGDRFGAVLRAADYDHDGIDDIIAAAWSGMRVVSGREGIEIARFIPNSTNWTTFEAQPLRTPSGFPHFFVSTQGFGTFHLSATPRGSRSLGLGCAIGTPTHDAPRLGMRELTGFDRRLTLSGAQPGTVAFLLLGLTNGTHVPLNLAPLGLPLCSVYPDIQIIGGFTTGTTGLQAGFTRHDFAIPSASAFGRGIDAQWVTLDPTFAPAGLSNAIRFAIQP